MIVGGVELKASIWHGRNGPTTSTVVHANLGWSCRVLVTFAGTDNADDLSRAPRVVVVFGILGLGAVVLGFDDEQIIGPDSLAGIERASEAPGGALGEEGEWNDFVDRFSMLRRNDLMQLQEHFGPDVDFGARLDGLDRLGYEIGRLGAREALARPVFGGTAGRRGRPGDGRRGIGSPWS